MPPNSIPPAVWKAVLHEAIPGHHYQMSLQMRMHSCQNFAALSGTVLTVKDMRFIAKASARSWDCIQIRINTGRAGDEIHRAIRLVVDVAMHTGKMTREEAIKYMMDNEAISLDGATAEIERYMAYPAQALSYKTGALKNKGTERKNIPNTGQQI